MKKDVFSKNQLNEKLSKCSKPSTTTLNNQSVVSQTGVTPKLLQNFDLSKNEAISKCLDKMVAFEESKSEIFVNNRNVARINHKCWAL